MRPWDAFADPQGRQPLQPFRSIDELEAGVATAGARLAFDRATVAELAQLIAAKLDLN